VDGAGRVESRRRRVHNNLATALARSGRIAEAVPQYEKALELNPQYHAIHGSLGEALVSVGRPDEAIAQFGKALEAYPESASLHNESWRERWR
jgi:Tfp pilus assembly protein PilF